MYIARHVETTVARLSKMFGAILVAGPRQVGKTTMLKEVTQNIRYATMDDLVMRASAQEESGTFFKDNPPPVFVDEIQKAPELFSQIKMIIDRDHKKGQFFLCGSQQFKMMKNVSESLAGRIGLVTLLGFSLREPHGVEFDTPFIPTDEFLIERKNILLKYLMTRCGRPFTAAVCRSFMKILILTGKCSMGHMSALILSRMSGTCPKLGTRLNLRSL